jgi:hypothetical protein
MSFEFFHLLESKKASRHEVTWYCRACCPLEQGLISSRLKLINAYNLADNK